MRTGLRLIAGLFGAACIVLVVLFFYQRRLIYPAPAFGGAIVADGFIAAELKTADGLKLAALYRPAQAGRPTMVFFHGNGDSLRGSIAATASYAAAGFGVLLPEYRGYGGNPGSPSEPGLYADGRAALAYLQSRRVEPADIVVLGNSLGSGVATQMALENRLRGLIIISGYSSLPDAVANALGAASLKPLVRDRFDNIGKLDRIASPVLILHGSADRTIPVTQGRALHAAASRSEYQEFGNIGHQLAYGPAAQQAVIRWADAVAAR